MSQVVPKEEAERLAFSFQPRTIKRGISDGVKGFVKAEEDKPNDFKISPLIEQTTGMADLKKRQLQVEVEEAVLQHVKELEENAYKKAYDLGLVEGREKAFEESKGDIQIRLSGIDELLKNMEALKLKMLKENEVLMVKLALEVGKKIAARELSLGSEPIVPLLRDLVEGVKKDEKAILRLSKVDSDFIEDLRQRNDEHVDFLQNIKIVPTPDMMAGGCILETNYGSIDSTIQERVSRTWDTLIAKVPDLRGHAIDVKDDDADTQS